MRIGLRIGVALVIIVPLLGVLPGGWLTTFTVALTGFAAARVVERLALGPAPTEPPGKQGLWAAVAAACIGVVLLGVVQFFEYRLARERDAAVEEFQRAHEGR